MRDIFSCLSPRHRQISKMATQDLSQRMDQLSRVLEESMKKLNQRLDDQVSAVHIYTYKFVDDPPPLGVLYNKIHMYIQYWAKVI